MIQLVGSAVRCGPIRFGRRTVLREGKSETRSQKSEKSSNEEKRSSKEDVFRAFFIGPSSFFLISSFWLSIDPRGPQLAPIEVAPIENRRLTPPPPSESTRAAVQSYVAPSDVLPGERGSSAMERMNPPTGEGNRTG